MLNKRQKNPKQELLFARRMIEQLEDVEIIEDLKWDPLIDKWILLCKLTPSIPPNQLIPSSTNWYIHIEDAYPWGEINFLPAKINGLMKTFPHQNYNGEGRREYPWRNGKICLDTSYKKFKHIGLDNEPYNSEFRLLWHFKRALSWLKDAATGKLRNPGDMFELPDFHSETLSTVAFLENNESFLKWQRSRKSYGFVKLLQYKKEEPLVMVPLKFVTPDKRIIYHPHWGTVLANQDNKMEILNGAWIMLRKVPIIPPWQAPMTWLELKCACKYQKIDLLSILNKISSRLRDNKAHILLIGFPIPDKVHNKTKIIYWQPLLLPKLNNVTRRVNGFRDIEKYNSFRDRNDIFDSHKQIHWLHSNNWHKDELFSRGRINTKKLSILQLGAGAVGSMISELLVRSGHEKISIMDSDLLEPGNIVRNTLTLKNILKYKVDGIIERLNNISPYSDIKVIHNKFTPSVDIQLKDFDLILDCTGEDDTMFYLSQYKFDNPKTFISISLGYGAKRLFVYYSRQCKFNHFTFVHLIQPWLEKEQKDTINIEFPRDGIGCWHPVFPARADDVWLMVSTAFKSIEHAIMTNTKNSTLLVFEQNWDEDVFTGISLISREEYDE